MTIVDKRFNDQTMSMISDLPGQVFRKYSSDPFVFTPSVYGIVGLYIGKDVFSITNFVQATDFFGSTEDVAVFQFERAAEEDVHSYMDDGELIDTPVDSVIKKVLIVNEHQRLFHNGVQTYDVFVTRGVIFKMDDGAEVSFEKDIWFSEEINIKRGHNLIEKMTPCESFTENWEGIDDYSADCSREIITIE